MKLLLALGLLLSPAVFANDGSVPYIEVNSIKTKVKEKQPIVMSGGEAYKLYEALPRNFVYDTSRALTISAKDKAVIIYCNAEAKDKDAETPVRDPAKTKCTIEMTDAVAKQKENEDTDLQKWEPSCKENSEL